jgi:hypothetical protein
MNQKASTFQRGHGLHDVGYGTNRHVYLL